MRKTILLGFTISLLLLFNQIAQAATSIPSVDVESFPAPDNLSATALSPNRIDLNWDLVAGAVSYKVYRDGLFIGSTSTNAYSDTGLSSNTTYAYTVSAVNTFGGESFQSSPSSATTYSGGGSGGGGGGGGVLLYIYGMTDIHRPIITSDGVEIVTKEDDKVQKQQKEKPEENIVEKKKEVCGTYLTEYLKFGSSNNNPEAVKKLKEFLNKYEGENLDVNNTSYDQAALDAVIRFQEKYAEVVLTPWGLTRGTGYVYKTTIRQINVIVCSTPSIEAGCSQYLTQFLHFGSNNDPEEVKKLQIFLWHYEGFTDLEVSGNFDWKTHMAVIAFQERYAEEILHPWDIRKGTGWVYITTLNKINELYCQKTEFRF